MLSTFGYHLNAEELGFFARRDASESIVNPKILPVYMVAPSASEIVSSLDLSIMVKSGNHEFSKNDQDHWVVTDNLSNGKFSIVFSKPAGTTYSLKQVVLRETDDI